MNLWSSRQFELSYQRFASAEVRRQQPERVEQRGSQRHAHGGAHDHEQRDQRHGEWLANRYNDNTFIYIHSSFIESTVA